MTSDLHCNVADTVQSLPDTLVHLIVQYTQRPRLLLLSGFKWNLGRVDVKSELLDADYQWRMLAKGECGALAVPDGDGDTVNRGWQVTQDWQQDNRRAVLARGTIVKMYDVHTGALLLETTYNRGGNPLYFMWQDRLHVLQAHTGALSRLEPDTPCQWVEVVPNANYQRSLAGVEHWASVMDTNSGKLYVAQSKGQLLAYDCTTGAVTYGPSFKHSRTHFSIVLVNGTLYVIGNSGATYCGRTVVTHKHVECLVLSDGPHGQWQEAPELTLPRWGPAVCVVDDEIIVVGGRTHSALTVAESTPTAERLHTLEQPVPTWKPMAPCQYAREESCLIVVGW
jgi:hypothetical protein